MATEKWSGVGRRHRGVRWSTGLRSSSVLKPVWRAQPARRARLDSAELGDCSLDRLELLDEGNGRVLLVIEDLRLLEDVGGVGLRHHNDAVFIGGDDVARIHFHACAAHWHVHAGEAVVAYHGGGDHAAAEDRELHLLDVWRVADTGIDDRSRQTSGLPSSGPPAAHSR